MTEQPTQKQADDLAIASGAQRKPSEFSHPEAGRKRLLVKKNNVLFECHKSYKSTWPVWLCGNCRSPLGVRVRNGQTCKGCGAKVKR